MQSTADISALARQIRSWLTSITEGLRDWAASDRGQLVMSGVDFLTLSTRIGEFYAHAGWYLPVHPAFQRFALEHVTLSIPFDPRAAARVAGPSSRHWGWIVEGTLASPSLATRKALVEDALFSLEHQRWHGATCALLPVIEGLIAERSGILDNMRVGRRMDHILHHDAGQWETLAAVPAANILDNEVFDRVPFADLDVDDDLLNRHSILHGATAGFGTRLNALRTFFLLVATVEILDGAIVLRTDAAPPEMARCWMSTEHLPSSEQPRGGGSTRSPRISRWPTRRSSYWPSIGAAQRLDKRGVAADTLIELFPAVGAFGPGLAGIIRFWHRLRSADA